jgi:DNA primase
MAGRIPRQFIDDLLARTDIVELIDQRVPLKKAGRNYQACCPFHNEKTPSFTVSQDKQFFHCFGCGENGNALSFLMEYDRLEFPEAVEELARYHGLDVPREKGRTPVPQNKQALSDNYALMEQVAAFYQKQLKVHSQKQQAIDYLKKRGLSGEIAKAYQLGFAPDSWNELLNTFGTSEEKQRQLLELKLINQNDKQQRYDFFRHRIIFPIHDKRGRVVGFGGRVLDDGTPKYLNSPETPIFHKGQELYGLFQARQNHRSLPKVLIVEGYMDVVALAQFDIKYAVASLGTSTTAEHIQLLSRQTKTLVCCYDGDNAGREAAWRTMENALPFLKDGLSLQFLFLPDGEDPDSMIRKLGKEEFESKLNHAMPLSKFLFDRLLQQHQVNSTEGKAALIAAALPLIEKVAGEQQQHMLFDTLGKITGEQRFLQASANANLQRTASNSSHQAPVRVELSPLRMMMALLLSYPRIASNLAQIDPSLLANHPIAGLPLLIELHQFCKQHPQTNTGNILERFRTHEQGKHLGKLLGMDVPALNVQQVYSDSFSKLVEMQIDGRRQQLIAKSEIDTLSQDEMTELNLLIKNRNRKN